MRRKENHAIIVKQKEERRVAKEQRKLREKLKMEAKQKEEERMKSLTGPRKIFRKWYFSSWGENFPTQFPPPSKIGLSKRTKP